MNITWSKNILRELAFLGVRDVVYCAGARNAPLVAVLGKTAGQVNIHSFFEERSAAFFALGLARKTSRPVAIITTSGTAVAELLPAVIEAHHTDVPLIIVSADRPRRLRGLGAPQAIEQTGIFAKFVRAEFDLENGKMFSSLTAQLRGSGESVQRKGPVHINVCFDEPLIDEAHVAFAWPQSSALSSGFSSPSLSSARGLTELDVKKVKDFLAQPGEMIAIVGQLASAKERAGVCDFLLRLGVPVYAEGTSGLRENPRLKPLQIVSGDAALSWSLKSNRIARVLRLGGVPTARVWRDLDSPSCSVQVLSISSLPFPGLSRGEFVCAPLNDLNWAGSLLAQELSSTAWDTGFLARDHEIYSRLELLLESEPTSEPALMRRLSQVIPSESLIYLGNSLPIRQWDLVAHRDHPLPIEANRGVNGIDGQVSTFLGLCGGDRENWAIIGDLTAMYDLAAPWAVAQTTTGPLRIVVINNFGGQIFARTPSTAAYKESFLNRHAIDFSAWAKMWNWNYNLWDCTPDAPFGSSSGLPTELPSEGINRVVIEVRPNALATERFWKSYDSFSAGFETS